MPTTTPEMIGRQDGRTGTLEVGEALGEPGGGADLALPVLDGDPECDHGQERHQGHPDQPPQITAQTPLLTIPTGQMILPQRL